MSWMIRRRVDDDVETSASECAQIVVTISQKVLYVSCERRSGATAIQDRDLPRAGPRCLDYMATEEQGSTKDQQTGHVCQTRARASTTDKVGGRARR